MIGQLIANIRGKNRGLHCPGIKQYTAIGTVDHYSVTFVFITSERNIFVRPTFLTRLEKNKTFL